MRRSCAVFRASKGYSWYTKFKSNPEVFSLYTKLAPFNWAEGNIARPKAVFDLESNGESVGRLQFELAHDVVPQTVTNFINLIKGEGPNNFTYKNSKLHLIRKGEVVMGGDVEGGSGKLSHSSFKERYFEDENFIIPHTARGLISMATVGVKTNGSQFYISLCPTQWMNGRCVVFGRLVNSDETLAKLEKIYSFMGVPANDVVIKNCEVTLPADFKSWKP